MQVQDFNAGHDTMPDKYAGRSQVNRYILNKWKHMQTHYVGSKTEEIEQIFIQIIYAFDGNKFTYKFTVKQMIE